MNGEAPATQIGLGSDGGAVTRNDVLIVVAPSFSPSSGNAAGAFRLDEFHTTGIGKAFFGRVYNLDHMTMRACSGELRDCGAHVGNR